jgi:hypothetical protein
MAGMKRILILAAIAAAAAHGGTPADQERAPLDQPLTATNMVIFAPAGDLSAPSDASELGLLSRVARLAGVPFGFEADEAAPRPTTGAAVEAHDVSARTLRDALDGFVRMDSRYEWRDVRGVVVMRTHAAWSDSRNALNQPVRDVEWRDVDAIAAFNRVARLLYPDAARDPFEGMLAPRTGLFSVQLHGGTLLDVLNAAARADGQLGWAVSYGPASSATRFTLTIGHYGNGPSASWPERPGIR